MRSYRNNPESYENTEATKQADRERFAIQMQNKQDEANHSEKPNSSNDPEIPEG